MFSRKSHRLLDNVEKYGGDRGATNDVTIWRIRVACWISKSICTYAHSHAYAPGYPHARTRKYAHTGQYIILIAIPQQQWLRERASVLRYTYIACLVIFAVVRCALSNGTIVFILVILYDFSLLLA